MFRDRRTLLRWLGRWPRRVAALLCLLLAAASAVTDGSAAHPAAKSGSGPRLAAGQVAVPVPVTVAADAAPGDRVGVLAGPGDDSTTGDLPPPGRATLVADGLRVLSVRDPDSGLTGSDVTIVVVAASRTLAVRLARYSGRAMVLITDRGP
jgi:hypothetical protein